MKLKVEDILIEAAALFVSRNEQYGDAYTRHGEIAAKLFPEGVSLKTPEEFYQWHIYELMLIKMNRIANAMAMGQFHEDSYNDIMVYAAMALEQHNKKQHNKQKEF